MDGLIGGRRRQLLGAALAVCLTLGVVTAFLAAGASQPDRAFITLDKHCELSSTNGPIFDLVNTSSGADKQAIDVQITDRYYIGADAKLIGVIDPRPNAHNPETTIHLEPGDKVTVQAVPGVPWKSTYKREPLYFAHFKADVHVAKKGKKPAYVDFGRSMQTHEYCACKKPTASTTTTSVKPTTSTSTTSTSTSTSTTSTSTSTSTTSTSTSTTSTSTTSTSTSTTSTTIKPTTTTTLGET